MPLHIDYRPKTLKEVEGNRATVESLQSVLERESDIPHAFLFTGQSGCGKTTLGRIVVETLGCAPQDFREVDSAQFRGIDTVREIRQQTRLRPIAGPCRVWLMDEVHMLGRGGSSASNEAQNALLKILEDTPPHVYFILCTTDPDKLLKTIRGRCMQFQVNPLSERQMTRLLKRVVGAEGVKGFPDEAYGLLHKVSFGQPRDALVALDKVIDLPNEQLLKAIEQTAGGEASVQDLCRLLMHCAAWKDFQPVLKSITETQEPETVRRYVMTWMQNELLSNKEKVKQAQAFLVLAAFREPFFNTGKPGLVGACFESVCGE